MRDFLERLALGERLQGLLSLFPERDRIRDRAEFLCSEASAGLKRNGWMTFAAISTAAIALFLIGGLGHLYYTGKNYANSLATQFTIRAFLEDGATEDMVYEAMQQVRLIKGVAEVQWVPKAVAWDKWRKEYPDVTEGLENPFPDALKIRPNDLNNTNFIVGKLRSMDAFGPKPTVEYLEPEQRLLSDGLSFIQWLGIALGGLGFLTAGVLIHNAIRLTVLSRRREIRIMQLVGASYATIRIPFLIEGAVQGAVGGIVAAILLWSTHTWLAAVLTQFSALGHAQSFPIVYAFFILVFIGTIYGVICSAIAVRSPLKLGANA